MNHDFKSYSQAGQDAFVHALLGGTGTFLDIGANEPVHFSNTYGLEQIGWTGWLCEIEESLCAKLEQERKARVIRGNATLPYWNPIKCGVANMPTDISYLSLDIDEGTLDALRCLELLLPEPLFRFKVITVEHDSYRFGEKLRGPEREILSAAGYVLVRPDVANKDTPDMPFEDWFTIPELAEKARSLP
jgi:hypothetical protein